MVIEGGIYGYIVPAGRIIAGFFVGVMLAIVGGWAALTFNAMAGYPWAANVHLGVYIVGIGVGAGLGAYVGWINLSLRWYIAIATFVIVLLAGIAGSTLGNIYWEFLVGETYLGPRDSRINATHFGAALGATLVSSMIGLYFHFRTRS